MPPQLIYTGRTPRCHPSFPENWNVTHSESHWSTVTTMIEFLERILIPYVNDTLSKMELPSDFAAVATFDVFAAHSTQVSGISVAHRCQVFLLHTGVRYFCTQVSGISVAHRCQVFLLHTGVRYFCCTQVSGISAHRCQVFLLHTGVRYFCTQVSGISVAHRCQVFLLHTGVRYFCCTQVSGISVAHRCQVFLLHTGVRYFCCT